MNAELFERAQKVLPGGVCSSVRFNRGIGHPVYVAKADGARFTDVDGREYLDMACSHGAVLLGHGHPSVREAVRRVADLGICCSADTPYHVDLAETLCRIIPCAEKVRYTNSGTEATLHALRLCRAVSGRDKIIRFIGHFHGYHEYTYIGGHPPREQLSQASRFRESAGIPEPMSRFIIAVPFNDLDKVESALRKHRDEVGTVILEPINFNSGGIHPQPGYLESLRELTRKYDVLLFFDEILSSFRKSAGGVQQDLGVTPDICTIGKALGGGLPLSAICGPEALMDRYKPVGDVQHSGTFNAHLVSILGGLAFLEVITRSNFYPDLMEKTRYFHSKLDEIVARLGVPIQVPRHGARFGLIMGIEKAPKDYEDVLSHRKDIMLSFIKEAARRGVYFCDYGGNPSHHGFSAAHTKEDLDRVLEVMEEAFKSVKDAFSAPK